MADESKFQKFAGKLPGIVGTGVSAIGGVVNVFRRKTGVRAWAQAKREERRRLKTAGLSGSELRQALRAWSATNPRPQGSDPYNPTVLGVSNQNNPNAQGDLGSFTPLPNNLGTRTDGSFVPGLQRSSFSPFWLLLAIPLIFPKQFKRLTKIKY